MRTCEEVRDFPEGLGEGKGQGARGCGVVRAGWAAEAGAGRWGKRADARGGCPAGERGRPGRAQGAAPRGGGGAAGD